jgi:hypothetical protein
MSLAAEEREQVPAPAVRWRRHAPLLVTLAFCGSLALAARAGIASTTILIVACAFTGIALATIYLASVRTGRRPVSALLSVVLPVLATCRFLGLVGAWAWASAVLFGALEIVVMVQAIREVRALMRGSDGDRRSVHEVLTQVVENRMGRSTLSRVIAYELSMYAYAFTRRAQLPCSGEDVYRDRGQANWRQLVWVLLILFVVEGAVVHLLLSRWSVVAAWVLAAMQVYGAIWLLADVEALRRYPICADAEGLELRLGMRVRARIDWKDVEGVTEVEKEVEGALRCYLSGSPNLLLVMKEPLTATIALGLERSTQHIALALDEPARFVEMVRRRLHRSSPHGERDATALWTTF